MISGDPDASSTENAWCLRELPLYLDLDVGRTIERPPFPRRVGTSSGAYRLMSSPSAEAEAKQECVDMESRAAIAILVLERCILVS